MQRFLLHTHFYQPERSNPWTGTLDPEPSAAPFRDWNERIHAECYRANAFARIYDGKGRVERIVNAYEHLSFNLGPTLLAWLERTHPSTYARILAADQLAVARTGHGNALAQSFHHTILPLDDERDRRTQIRWGTADFRHRFGRDPEGMWLPETAANQAVVDALIDEGIAFTVLAPRQIARVREPGGAWHDVDSDPDPSVPYRIVHSDGSGRALAAFVYDGSLAQRLAFDPKAMESAAMLDALTGAARGGLLHAALDGETFGHHHRFGELGLAYTLAVAAAERGFEPTNYGTYLADHPPAMEAELVGGAGSSWSCAHGVGRWSADCGCASAEQPGWNQQWRQPLRAALDIVREKAAAVYAEQGGELLRDPWAARDAYADVLGGATSPEAFLAMHAVGPQAEGHRTRIWTLLECQRNAMAMYTSCGWFFADVSRIETVYVLRFAARALELLDELGAGSPREAVHERLAQAHSNRPGVGTGADVWRDRVLPETVTPRRVAAQAALCAAAQLDDQQADGHDVDAALRVHRSGGLLLAVGTVRVRARATERRATFTVAGLGLGGLDLRAWVGDADDAVLAALDALGRRLASLPVAAVSAEIEGLLGEAAASPGDALPSGRAALVEAARARTLRDLRGVLATAHARVTRDLDLLRAAGAALPAELRALEHAAHADELERWITELGAQAHPSRLPEHVERTRAALQAGHDLEMARLREALSTAVELAVTEALSEQTREHVEWAEALLSAAGDLGMHLDVQAAQEAAYGLARRAAAGAPDADPAVAARLGELLGVAPSVWGD